MMGRRKDADEADDKKAAKKDRQRGFVLVWMAATIFVLLAVAAFAVDLVHAYVVGQETQNAADAAALAGAAQIPGGCPHANAIVDGVAQSNMDHSGFSTAPGGPAVVTEQCAVKNANEMDVDIKTTFDTWFARAIGIDQLTVHRTATAQYDAKVAMGSPANHLGDVPHGSCVDLGFPAGPTDPCMNDPLPTQNLFLQINGPDTNKSNGNAYTSNWCATVPGQLVGTDGCPSGDGQGVNTDYNSQNTIDPLHGETFDIGDQIGGPTNIAIYDAGFVNTAGATGSWCDPAAVNITDPSVLLSGRYYAYSPYCAGDIGNSAGRLGPAGTTTNLPDTHYQLLDPDGNPIPGCPAIDVNGVWVTSGGTIASQDPSALQYFQHWVYLCPSSYASTVTTPDKPYQLHVWSTTGQGANAFSILALHGSSPFGLNVYATEHLPLYASKPSASPATFYVARVSPSNLDRTLSLSFFDLGDNPLNGGSPSVQLDMGHSPDVTWGGGGPQCRYTIPPGTPPEGGRTDDAAPWGGPSDWSAWGPCSITTDVNWLSQWVTVQVKIPSDNGGGFNCTPGSSTFNCWVTMTMTPNGVPRLQDDTTWDADMNGAPVRLTG
jgi:hypothetical protein